MKNLTAKQHLTYAAIAWALGVVSFFVPIIAFKEILFFYVSSLFLAHLILREYLTQTKKALPNAVIWTIIAVAAVPLTWALYIATMILILIAGVFSPGGLGE